MNSAAINDRRQPLQRIAWRGFVGPDDMAPDDEEMPWRENETEYLDALQKLPPPNPPRIDTGD